MAAERVEPAVGEQRRVVEPVPVGALGRAVLERLPRRPADGRPALDDLVPERHRRPRELEVDALGQRVAVAPQPLRARPPRASRGR